MSDGRDKRGVWVYYRVRPEALRDLGALIGTLPAAADEASSLTA